VPLFDTRLARYAPASARYLVVCAALAVLGAGCAVAQAGLLAHVLSGALSTDALSADAPSPGGQGASWGPGPGSWVAAALAAAVVVRAVLAWAHACAAHRAAATVRSQLRTRVFAHLARLGSCGRPDERAALMTRGLEALDPYFSRFLPRLTIAAVVPFTALLTLAAVDRTAAAIVLVTLPLTAPVAAIIALYGAERAERRRSELDGLMGHFTDMVTGLPTLKAFGRVDGQVGGQVSDQVSEKSREIIRTTEEYRRVSMGLLRPSLCSTLMLEVAATLAVGLVAVSAGVRLASGSLTLERGLYALLLTPEVYLPLRRLAVCLPARGEGPAAAQEVFRLLETPAPPASRTTMRPRLSIVDLGGRDDPATLRAPEIRVEDLVLAHPGRPPVGPVSFTLAPGTTTALAGPPGAGKSSVIAAMLGFVTPAAGRIAVGHLDLTADDGWRRRIAWVPQRPALFAGTVADNIAMAAPGASSAEVREAAARAGVTGFTSLGAALGPAGAGLPALERRRLALARAMLRCAVLDASLLLFDEPTADADVLTEIEMCEAMESLWSGRTTLVVTDRQCLLGRVDRVVRLGPAPVAVPA
jgi:ABC-type transport system involved in cytochrome bd biosynthesis fused ATPase/permease subunit